MISSKIVLSESGVSFGTSGARGLVSQFTPNVCGAFAVAFARVMQRSFVFSEIAIAVDNRPSSYAMAQSCASALNQIGIATTYYGVIPTPALAYTSMQEDVPAIMVTGSHIPFDRNGLKFYRPDGEISKQDEFLILDNETNFQPVVSLPNLVINEAAASYYCERYSSLFSSSSLEGLHIGIYEHSSAGRDLYPNLFRGLGAKVTCLERSDEFVPIDTEAVSPLDVQKALDWSRKYNFDAIFSTDGDGDRPLVSDENGNWLRGDILGLLCSKELNIEALAVPVSCNTSIELSGYFKHIQRTKIGSPYVIAEFENLSSNYRTVAGFEANGGFLLGCDVELNGEVLKALPTRDALLPAFILLAKSKTVKISQQVNALPLRYTHSDRIKNFERSKSKLVIDEGKNSPELMLRSLGFSNVSVVETDETDGLRMVLSNNTIVHLRPSGNAPELRCYVEAASFELAKEIVERVLSKIIQTTEYLEASSGIRGH
ncbi:phosphomannomutase [Shewanella canadensis]|uniref:Phosphomannomutase n=1 Tax=Shewanella canadensis TaxID=271096 RepID=A0A3S0K5E0_9GAMM|nr:phosphomannomutase [Shewanella canadensis]RTR35957.1 phosphomannomutase [Shewanella canadensis]